MYKYLGKKIVEEKFEEEVKEKTAVLLTETRPDIFQLKLGSLSAGSECLVTVTFLLELPVEETKTRLTLPSTIAPKYVTYRQHQSSVVPKALKSNLSKEQSPSPLSLNVKILMKTRITSVVSPSHSIQAEMKEEGGHFEAGVKFAGNIAALDRDLILLIKCEEPHRTRSLSTQTGTTGWKYSEEEIKQGALLMYSSPKTYKLLRSFSNERYPCPSTIQKHVQGFRCCFGINQEMFFLLSQKLQTLLEIDRNVALVFDEIALQPQTDYSQHLKMRLPSAKKAMVVMVRGLRKSFKEVVYYDFDRGMDMELLVELIKQVQRAGASVRAVTLDMGNQTLLRECKVNINVKPYQNFIDSCFLLRYPKELTSSPTLTMLRGRSTSSQTFHTFLSVFEFTP